MIRIGRFVKVHGIHGEVVCHLTPPFYYAKGFLKTIDVGCEASHHPWEVASIQPDPRGFRVKFRDISSVEEARDLIGAEVFLSPETLNRYDMIRYLLDKPSGEWIGYRLADGKEDIGEIVGIEWREAHPNFLILTNDREWEFPAVSSLIERIDEKERRITIKSLEGISEI